MDRNRLLPIVVISAALVLILIYASPRFLPGILTLVPGGEQFYPVEPDGKFAENQVFTGDQALDIINISMNDMFVNERLGTIPGLTENLSYTTGGVRAIRCLERNPEISYGLFVPHYFRVLPAVEYIIGERLEEGINMYAFVDPDRRRVAYIGYAVRPGAESGSFTYEKGDSGVLIRGINRTGNRPVETLTNVTIVDCGYDPSVNLTEAQERAFIDIALNDSRVKHYLDGFDYRAEINGGSYEWEYGTPHNYIIFYPRVDFLIKDAQENWSPFIRVNIDPRYKTGKKFQPPAGVVEFN